MEITMPFLIARAFSAFRAAAAGLRVRSLSLGMIAGVLRGEVE